MCLLEVGESVTSVACELEGGDAVVDLSTHPSDLSALNSTDQQLKDAQDS